MSEMKQLRAVARDRVGKGAARAVRRQGQIPAVLYGGGEAAAPIALDGKEAHQLIYAGHFLTTVFEIEVDGHKTRAIPRDYQLDPVRDTPVHVDFLRLSAGQTIRVEIPIHIVGQEDSPGIKDGGTVQLVEHSLELIVAAEAIPASIDISVAGLSIGASVHLADITLPEGARAVSQENPTLVTIAAPMQEEAPAAAPEGEAAPAPAAEPAPAKT